MEQKWIKDGMLEWCYLGGSWERWRCRVCGESVDRHFNEHISEYSVHRYLEDAERCIDIWAKRRRPRR